MEDFINFALSSQKTWTHYKNVGEFLSENISFHCYGLVQWRLSKGLHLVNVFCQYCNGWLLRSSNIWREYTAVVVNEWAIWSALWNRPGFTAHSIFRLMVIFVLMNLKLWCQICGQNQRSIFQIFWKADTLSLKFEYRTRAIITRGLFTFYPLFEVQKRFFKKLFS